MIEHRFHWFSGAPGRSEGGEVEGEEERPAFVLAAIQALAERATVVVWHEPGVVRPRGLPGAIEWISFAPSNPVYRRLNDGMAVYDLLDAGGPAAWAAGALMTCPGVVLVRRTRWNQLAANLPGAPVQHLRFAREEHGDLGLAAASAYWRGDLAAAELERRFPLPGWVVHRALAVLVETSERDGVVDPRHGVPVFELPSDPAMLADRLTEIAPRSHELRECFAARLLADRVGAAARSWVTQDGADLTFTRAAAAISGLFGHT